MHVLSYERTDDISCLNGFHCGIYEMDLYIQKSLQSHLNTAKDLCNYIIRENGVVVALCTLKDHKLKIALNDYVDTVAIEYLAVRREVQNQGIGREIISWIVKQTRMEKPEIRIITVDAFMSDITGYSAVAFYKKCGFITIQKKHPMAETVKMALAFNPKE